MTDDAAQRSPALGSSDPPPTRQLLSTLDADFIRVLEDLVDALLSNGTLRLTDLPPEALLKLSQRRQARARLRDALDLIADDEPLI